MTRGFLLSSLLFVLPMAAQAESVAVMPLKSNSLEANTLAILDRLLLATVSERSGMKTIGAADINAMLGLEKMKEALGCDEFSCAAEVGGALGVEYLLVSSADVLGSKLVLTMGLLDIRSAQAKNRTSLSVPNNEDSYADGIEQIVLRLWGLAPGVTRTAAPATRNGLATLKVTSPEPGEIFLNGQPTKERTPYLFRDMSAGSYVVSVSGKSQRGTKTIVLQNGDRAEVDVVLDQATSGSVRVESEQAGAKVLLNGEPVGDAPVLIDPVPTGRHTVVVEAPGHLARSHEVVVRDQETAQVSVNLYEERKWTITGSFVSYPYSYAGFLADSNGPGFGLGLDFGFKPRWLARARVNTWGVEAGAGFVLFGSERTSRGLLQSNAPVSLILSAMVQYASTSPYTDNNGWETDPTFYDRAYLLRGALEAELRLWWFHLRGTTGPYLVLGDSSAIYANPWTLAIGVNASF